MSSVSEAARLWRAVIGESVETLARETGFVQRRSKVTGPVFVQTLVFGWASNAQASVEELAQTAAAVGVGVSAQGLYARFTERAARFLQEVLGAAVHHLVRAEPVVVPVLSRFNGVYVYDSSTIVLPAGLKGPWPGCGGSIEKNTEAALKVQTRWELLTGEMLGPVLQSARKHDMTATTLQAPLPPGALCLADTGYFSLSRLQALRAQGVYWLSRVPAHLTVREGDGPVGHLASFLRQTGETHVDRPVLLGEERVPARLVAKRLPPEVADARKRRMRKDSQRRGKPLSADRLALCAWLVYATNVEEERLSAQEAMVVYRVRWQIEILFKVWKSHLRVDEWRSQNPWRILCEVYAKLLACLLTHWLLLLGAWHHLDRSLWKAEKTIQRLALHLAAAFARPHQFVQAMKTVVACIDKGCRLNKSRQQPRTIQLLLDLEHGGLA